MVAPVRVKIALRAPWRPAQGTAYRPPPALGATGRYGRFWRRSKMKRATICKNPYCKLTECEKLKKLENLLDALDFKQVCLSSCAFLIAELSIFTYIVVVGFSYACVFVSDHCFLQNQCPC